MFSFTLYIQIIGNNSVVNVRGACLAREVVCAYPVAQFDTCFKQGGRFLNTGGGSFCFEIR